MSAHSHTPPIDVKPNPLAGERLTKKAMPLMGVGGLILLAGLGYDLYSGAATSSFGYSYLFGFAFVWTIALGCLFLTALHHLTNSTWSTIYRRVAECYASYMHWLLIAMAPILLLLVANMLFPWTDEGYLKGHTIVEQKLVYLNAPFFIFRVFLYFMFWVGFAQFYLKNSLRQDIGAGASLTVKMRKRSAPFMLIFALTATFAAFDWLMSLDPVWFSTIFGVYIFGGMFLSALSVITLTMLWLKKNNMLGGIELNGDRLYSLGALQFAFTVFWGYIALSQLLLYYYANLPEETGWFYTRWHTEGWWVITLALLTIRFIIPFGMLLSRPSKMNEKTLVYSSILILIGQALDLHWLILPQYGLVSHTEAPLFLWTQAGGLLFAVGALILMFGQFIKKHPIIAIGDPTLEESRRFHL